MSNLFLVGIHLADTSKLDDVRCALELGVLRQLHSEGIAGDRSLVDILGSYGLGRIKFNFTGFRLFDLDSLEFIDISLDEYLNSDVQINGLDLDKSGDLLINVSGYDIDSLDKVVPLFFDSELIDLDYKIGESVLFSNRKSYLELGEHGCYVSLTLDAEKEDFNLFYRNFCITSPKGSMCNNGYYIGGIHRGVYEYPIDDLLQTAGVDVAGGIWYFNDIAIIDGYYSGYDTYIVNSDVKTVVIDVGRKVSIVLPKAVDSVVIKDCCNYVDDLSVIYLSKGLNSSDLRRLIVEMASGFVDFDIKDIGSLSTEEIVDKLRIGCVDIQYY